MSLQETRQVDQSRRRSVSAKADEYLRRSAAAPAAGCRATGLLIAFWRSGRRPARRLINPACFRPSAPSFPALWTGISGGALLDDIAISLQRSGTAFVGAVVLAIPLGLLMGQVRPIENALDPVLQLFRQTSALALYPVFILLLGLGEASSLRHLPGDASFRCF